jgi:hypothetical protein
MTLIEENNDAIKARAMRPTRTKCWRTYQPLHNGALRSKAKDYQKKKLSRATERNSERVQQLRVEYWHEIGAVNLEDLARVDETGSRLGNDKALCPFCPRQPRL